MNNCNDYYQDGIKIPMSEDDVLWTNCAANTERLRVNGGYLYKWNGNMNDCVVFVPDAPKHPLNQFLGAWKQDDLPSVNQNECDLAITIESNLKPRIRNLEAVYTKHNERIAKLESEIDANASPHFDHDDYREIVGRIEKLEKAKPALSYSPKGVEVYFDSIINPILERIEKLEKDCDKVWYDDCRKAINNSREQIERLENNAATNTIMGMNRFISIDNRIEKLESHYYSDGDLSAIHGQIDNINKNIQFEFEQRELLELRLNGRIEELEAWTDTHQKEGEEYGRDFEERDENLTERIERLENNNVTNTNMGMSMFKSIEERIDKLESENKMRQDTIATIDRTYDQCVEGIYQRIEKLESRIEDPQHDPLKNAIACSSAADHEHQYFYNPLHAEYVCRICGDNGGRNVKGV